LIATFTFVRSTRFLQAGSIMSSEDPKPESWAHRNAVHIMTVVLFSLLAFVMFIQVAC